MSRPVRPSDEADEIERAAAKIAGSASRVVRLTLEVSEDVKFSIAARAAELRIPTQKELVLRALIAFGCTGFTIEDDRTG